MKMPCCQEAYIPVAKVEKYLLSETHAVGRSKAKFFKKYGFNLENVDLLEQGLLTIAYDEVTEILLSPYGTKYVIIGELETPSTKKVTIQTVWIIENRESIPRFVTAYPK